jgi:hypothetical protein
VYDKQRKGPQLRHYLQNFKFEIKANIQNRYDMKSGVEKSAVLLPH